MKLKAYKLAIPILAKFLAFAQSQHLRAVVWDEIVPECEYGPRQCNGEDACMIGYACVDDLVCAPIQETQCADAACPEGSVEDPFAWCSCITLEERDNLFCALQVVE